MKRGVNMIRRWSKEFNSIKQNGESNQSADGQPKDRPIERMEAVIKHIRQNESTVEAGQSTIGNMLKSQF
jgi:hypothetical protein